MITNNGKDILLNHLIDGAYLALGTLNGGSFVELDAENNKGYARMPIVKRETAPDKPPTTTLYMYASGGVLTNKNVVYFADADNANAVDSLDPSEEDGWTTPISAIAIIKNNAIQYVGEVNPEITVKHAHRIKISTGGLSITLNVTESQG